MSKVDEPLASDHAGVVVRDLVARAFDNPRGGAAKVLADWCSERGLEDAARDLLVGDGGAKTQRAIAHLRGLFGSDDAEEVLPGRYRYPIGFHTTNVAANGGTAAISAQPQIPMILRKVVIPRRHQSSLIVTDVTIGRNSQLCCANPLPGELFDLWGPDIFADDVADVATFISVMLVNVSSTPLTLNMAALGVPEGGEGFEVFRGHRADFLTKDEATMRLAAAEARSSLLEDRLQKQDDRVRDLEGAVMKMSLRLAGAV